jgi:hypothetical protein
VKLAVITPDKGAYLVQAPDGHDLENWIERVVGARKVGWEVSEDLMVWTDYMNTVSGRPTNRLATSLLPHRKLAVNGVAVVTGRIEGRAQSLNRGQIIRLGLDPDGPARSAILDEVLVSLGAPAMTGFFDAPHETDPRP